MMLALFGFSLAVVFAQAPPCNITPSNGVVAGSAEYQEESYGNPLLSVYSYGTVIFKPGGPGFVTRDGAIGMKFMWVLGAVGTLYATGVRLDGDAGPVRLLIRGRMAQSGIRPSYLIFPTPGCWQLTGQVGDNEESKLTFITNVVKIGEGPGRWDP